MLHTLAAYLQSPAAEARALCREPRVSAGLWGYVVGGVSFAVASGLAGTSVFSWPFCIFSVFERLLWGFLLSAFLHILLEMMKGRGRALGLFTVFGLADFVWALAVPVLLILRLFLPVNGLGVWAAILAFGAADFFLRAKGLKDGYAVGWGRAAFAIVSPYLAVAALIAGIAALAILALLGGTGVSGLF